MTTKDLQTFVKIQDLKLKAKINTSRAERDMRRAKRLASKSKFGDVKKRDYVYRSNKPLYYNDFWFEGRYPDDELDSHELKFLDRPWR